MSIRHFIYIGDTHSVVVNVNEQGNSEIVEINEGDSVEDMLRYVHLDAEEFRHAFAQLANSKLPVHERSEVLAELDAGLKGYTYLEDI